MVKIPEPEVTTLTKLNQVTYQGRRGNTLPMSQLGDSCERKLWFTLHWAGPPEELSAKMSKIFSLGNWAEDAIITDLEKAGLKVTSRQEEVWGFAKHMRGFTDGRIANVPEAPKTEHLLEIKTLNQNRFNELVKKGVQRSNPKHYAQMQRPMRALKLKRGLYVGLNKNTCDYYVERLRYDPGFCDDLERKEQQIILSPITPPRHFQPGWFECKFCHFNGLCYNGEAVHQNCRTCQHVTKADEGKWVCTLWGGEHEIPKEIQLKGCDHYKAMVFDR